MDINKRERMKQYKKNDQVGGIKRLNKITGK